MLFQFDPTTFNEKMTFNEFLLYKYLQTISICIELSFSVLTKEHHSSSSEKFLDSIMDGSTVYV